jgi:hypothetical protein
MGAEALMKRDWVTALGCASRYVGKPYEVDMVVPMSDEQVKQFGRVSVPKPDDMRFGGQDYEWQQQIIGNSESATSIARQQFADNYYRPEGSNLDKMTEIINQKNAGAVKPGDKVWVPVAKQQYGPQFTAAANPSKPKAVELLNQYLSKITAALG